MIEPDYLQRKRTTHGLGLCTNVAIPKGTLIIEYTGERITTDEELISHLNGYVHAIKPSTNSAITKPIGEAIGDKQNVKNDATSVHPRLIANNCHRLVRRLTLTGP